MGLWLGLGLGFGFDVAQLDHRRAHVRVLELEHAGRLVRQRGAVLARERLLLLGELRLQG